MAAFLGALETPGALLIEGEAGIGKTTMWEAGVDMCVGAGHQVLSCRPAQTEKNLAFAGLGDLLGTVSEEQLDAISTPPRHALEVVLLRRQDDAKIDWRAVSMGAVELLERSLATQPVVIAIDDLQWLTPPRLACFRSSCGGSPAASGCCARSGPLPVVAHHSGSTGRFLQTRSHGCRLARCLSAPSSRSSGGGSAGGSAARGRHPHRQTAPC
jgi:hypothetical protein